MRTTTAILAAIFLVGCSAGRENAIRSPDPDDPGVIVFNLNAGDDLRAMHRRNERSALRAPQLLRPAGFLS